MQDPPQQSVVILATGGTIAGTSPRPGSTLHYRAATMPIEALLAAVPPMRDERLESEQVALLDSKDMDHATWHALAARIAHHLERPEVCGIVVTHGTDTLEESAYFLHRVLSPAKPVVLTAAMRPADALLVDGPQNLWDSVRLARCGGRGVMACLLGRVHPPDDLRKAHSHRLDAFHSDGNRLLGTITDGILHRIRDWPQCMRVGLNKIPANISAWPRVSIFLSHAGVSAASLDALCASGIRGLVVAGTGNGTIHESLQASLQRAAASGIMVWRASRCAEGGVLGEGEWPAAGALSPVQARIELMLQLMD